VKENKIVKGKRNPVKKNMDKYQKPQTHQDRVKAYKKQKARDKAQWDIDDELLENEEHESYKKEKRSESEKLMDDLEPIKDWEDEGGLC
jgi:hypothetical protein|tara:strand:- start:179 stop:445 length:267 start_codon:yes stop_codon:yes gene_type:complete